MKKSNTEQIGDVIRQFMRQEGIETPYNQFRLVQSWPSVMGENVAKLTGDIFIKNQTLFVQIKSPVLKQNLMMDHRGLARRLNEYVGAQVIEDVKCY